MKIAILKNSVLNLLGLGIPLITAIITIPILISSLGNEKFGILTLIWALISYAGIFDFGLGRAVTLICAENEKNGNQIENSKVIGCALIIVSGISLFVVLILNVFSTYIVSLFSKPSFEYENAIFALSLGIIPTMISAVLRGVLEYQGRFFILNIIRIPMGIFTFIGPIATIHFWGDGLDKITFILSASKFVFMILMLIPLVVIIADVLRNRLFYSDGIGKILIKQGGWMTVSNIISPLMTYIDRFIIASLSGVKYLTYYVTPQEIVTKLTLLPTAVTAVLFPILARNNADEINTKIYAITKWSVSLIIFITISIIYIFSGEILEFWIDENFSKNAMPILDVMLIGVFFTCVAQFPYTVIQSRGDSHLTAFIHIVEFPIYIVVIYFLVAQYGALGAAISWSLRNFLDYLVLLWFSKR